MKKFLIISVIIASCLLYVGFTGDPNKPVSIPATKQKVGDAAIGYKYLTTGDYIKSGIPYDLFLMGIGKDSKNYLQRDSFNKNISFEFTTVTAANGELVVAPNCLQCHAQVFEDKLYVGLGNSFIDFSDSKALLNSSAGLYTLLSMAGGKRFEASKNFLTATKAISPYLQTNVRGVNVADHLTGLLVSHRDPVTFKWIDKATLETPSEVVPTDVPAWWLLKKKNAMFYSGLGRGDFSRFLMASNLLTVSDTAESREVYNHFSDVLGYLYSIQPPKYTQPIDGGLAALGESIFVKNCSKCHGSYGDEEKYPNLLIPGGIIRTDSALYTSNFSRPKFIEWFDKSWFTQGENAASLVPFKGYIAPPLDGVWITSPYLHNGSVPTLEGVLNSKVRPTYWSRNFEKPEYDYDKVGWKYVTSNQPVKGAYNTTLIGYGNGGHNFGDKLSDQERKAVIEYLKTL
jgi:mono/diheme cytochrome c family protein